MDKNFYKFEGTILKVTLCKWSRLVLALELLG